MNTQVHICADSHWDGAESRALACALASPNDAIVVCTGNKTITTRMQQAGLKTIPAKFIGMFAPLNLSRIFRHLPAGRCELSLHSAEVKNTIEKAITLSGRNDLTLKDRINIPELPRHIVAPPLPDQQPQLMWLGHINRQSGLETLIEALGRLNNRQWTLKVVGEGDSPTVMPIVHRTRALGIDRQVKWTGYTDNVFAQMDHMNLGIITRSEQPDRMTAKEFAAAGITVIHGTDTETLYQLLTAHI
ncbi:MAG: glycosyltransferase [Muribaculaceae bacterium]|nr:glycosyltransferase [Muribaculaceae bacterium]